MVEEKNQELESKERVVLKRDLSVWVFRHGNWDYQTDALSEKGKQEAEEAGESLFEMIGEGEVVKLFVSPKIRTQQTAEKMQKALKQCSERKASKSLILGSPRKRRELVGPGFDWEYVGAAAKAGVPTEDLLRYWHQVDDPRGKVETPSEVQERFKAFLFHLGKLVSRLPEGPKVNLVLVSHGEVPGTLLKEAFGRTGLPNCKWVRFDFSKGEIEKVAMVTYDDQKSELGF
jgi:broad specificity phosphatase PhoE